MADYSDTELGRETSYSDQYDASLLYPIARAKARAESEAELRLLSVWICGLPLKSPG